MRQNACNRSTNQTINRMEKGTQIEYQERVSGSYGIQNIGAGVRSYNQVSYGCRGTLDAENLSWSRFFWVSLRATNLKLSFLAQSAFSTSKMTTTSKIAQLVPFVQYCTSFLPQKSSLSNTLCQSMRTRTKSLLMNSALYGISAQQL